MNNSMHTVSILRNKLCLCHISINLLLNLGYDIEFHILNYRKIKANKRDQRGKLFNINLKNNTK